MYFSNKLNDQINITHDKLGKGSFGSVYKAISNNKEIAIKCEGKEKNNNLTLLREFKICRKIFIIEKYLNYLRNTIIENLNLDDENKDNENKDNNENDNNENKNNENNENKNNDLKKKVIPLEEYEKVINGFMNNNSIIIFNHLTENNILLVPEELKSMWDLKFIPDTFSYIECGEYNFLTMELCEENFENILEKYNFDEDSKYHIALYLLNIMSYVHSCGIIHRDIKLSNFVMDKNFKPRLIDLGLSKEYYKYENGKVLPINPYHLKSITGTIRYISLNVHGLNSPNINDDLISLCYCLIVIFLGKNLPWVGHKKDVGKFEIENHVHENCPCGYHKNKKNNNLKLNTIAEIKFHTALEELTEFKYPFLVKWLKYLYNQRPKQMPSYNYLYKTLNNEYKNFKNLRDYDFKIIEKKEQKSKNK